MLERCWTDAGPMLDRCWTDAGPMLERCWNDAGTMLERRWNDAGTMLERHCNNMGHDMCSLAMPHVAQVLHYGQYKMQLMQVTTLHATEHKMLLFLCYWR